MAAIKASPATDGPVKRTATKSPSSPAKRPAANAANGSAPAKRAAKTAPRPAKSEAADPTKKTRSKGAEAKGRGTKAAKGGPAGRVVPVHLHAKVTEVGQLELSCRSGAGEESWKLEFNVRERAAAA